jgi:hypothetical protein
MTARGEFLSSGIWNLDLELYFCQRLTVLPAKAMANHLFINRLRAGKQ